MITTLPVSLPAKPVSNYDGTIMYNIIIQSVHIAYTLHSPPTTGERER